MAIKIEHLNVRGTECSPYASPGKRGVMLAANYCHGFNILSGALAGCSLASLIALGTWIHNACIIFNIDRQLFFFFGGG